MEKCNFDPVKLAECFVVKVGISCALKFILSLFSIGFFTALLFQQWTIPLLDKLLN